MTAASIDDQVGMQRIRMAPLPPLTYLDARHTCAILRGKQSHDLGIGNHAHLWPLRYRITYMPLQQGAAEADNLARQLRRWKQPRRRNDGERHYVSAGRSAVRT